MLAAKHARQEPKAHEAGAESSHDRREPYSITPYQRSRAVIPSGLTPGNGLQVRIYRNPKTGEPVSVYY